MTRSKPITFLASAALIPLAALAVAACGGGGSAATAATPKTTSGASATVGVANSGLGTITRSGGNRQVTYNGHPLYLFIKDAKPGQTTGQGVTAFGAAWFAVSPA